MSMQELIKINDLLKQKNLLLKQLTQLQRDTIRLKKQLIEQLERECLRKQKEFWPKMIMSCLAGIGGVTVLQWLVQIVKWML